MSRRQFLSRSAALASSLAMPVRSMAQDRPRRRIGIVLLGTEKSHGRFYNEFRNALMALGYVEGRDVTLDLRFTEDRLERLPGLLAELLALKPAILVTAGSPGVAAAQKATSTVPVVFASAGDPVGQGFIQSFRRPGANITGIAFNEDVNKKIYEVVRDVMPSAKRIATLVNETNPAQKHHIQDVPAMARQLGFEPMLVNATSIEAIEPAMQQAEQAKAQALVVSTLAPFIGGMRERIIAWQFKYQLPTFWGVGEATTEGGVASYSFPLQQNYRRAASLADQILKGANPAEIPVELPTHYEVAINVASAKRLGIVVPQAALLRADRVIQ